MVDLGVAAVRLQALNQVLDWDGQKMEFTNIPADATIRILEKDGFSIKDGHPTFQNKYTDPVNARQFAANLIKRQYRAGYELPARRLPKVLPKPMHRSTQSLRKSMLTSLSSHRTPTVTM